MKFKEYILNESTSSDVRKIVADYLKQKGIQGEFKVKTVDFSDLARASKVFVYGPKLNSPEEYTELESLGKQNNFIYKVKG